MLRLAAARGLGPFGTRGFRCLPRIELMPLVPFRLPDIGEGIVTAEIKQWFVKEGDHIREFDKLCEVESDKATAEITSPYEGVVRRLHYAPSAKAAVGKPLVDIEVAGDGGKHTAPAPSGDQNAPAAEAPAATAAPATAASPATPPAATNPKHERNRSLATPATRRLAKEQNLDLTQITGTGKDGRVTKEDILRRGTAPAAARQAQHQAPAAAAAATSPQPATVSVPLAADRVEDVTGIRRAMVKSMTAALQIPQFGCSDEIEMDRLMEVRKRCKAVLEANGQKVPLTYMPFIVKACSLALKDFPILNSSLNADASQITYKAQHNIGVAMDTPNGLIVPNIKSVQLKSIRQIAQELYELQQKGKTTGFSTNQITGGTFTISNIGVIGATYAKPVVFPPEVAIGAIGKIQKLPRYEGDKVVARHIMAVSWSADHRIIDGATMVRFSNRVIQFLENPETLLIDLA